MSFRITPSALPEVLFIETDKYPDERGYFLQSYKDSDFAPLGQKFLQDNFSFSKKHVLRGLHYQLPPFALGKFVRVLDGIIWDVAVDIRKSSRTFKQWVGLELSEDNAKAIYVPPGFAHGFVVISETARVLYKTTAEHHPELERWIIWNDGDLKIKWPISNPILSKRDQASPSLQEAEVFN